jgi:hypothetical protein
MALAADGLRPSLKERARTECQLYQGSKVFYSFP